MAGITHQSKNAIYYWLNRVAVGKNHDLIAIGRVIRFAEISIILVAIPRTKGQALNSFAVELTPKVSKFYHLLLAEVGINGASEIFEQIGQIFDDAAHSELFL